MDNGNINVLKSREEWERLYKSDNKVVVNYTASWCEPCQKIAPLFYKLSNEFREIIFLKVDVDEFEDIVEDMNVSYMPTFHFICNKKIIKELYGADSEELKKNILLLNEYLFNSYDSFELNIDNNNFDNIYKNNDGDENKYNNDDI